MIPRFALRPSTGIVAVTLLCLLPTSALAQKAGAASPQPGVPAAPAGPVTVQDRDNARNLLFEGRKKMAAGQYAEALKLFRAAHAIMNVPTTGLDLARAQEALHQLVEARETALAVTKIPVTPGEAKVFARARSDAATLAEALNPRIPSLVVVVRGPKAGTDVKVTIDGAVLPPATVGLPRRLDPGKHKVEVKAAGFVTAGGDVELKESESRTETISLEPAPPGAPGAEAPAQRGVGMKGPAGSTGELTAAGGASSSPASRPDPGTTERKIPVWVWLSGGVGLAAAGAGIGFLVDHLDARSTLERDCPGDVCDPAKYGLNAMTALRARWNRDLALSVGLGAVFLAGAGVSITGIVTAPADTGLRTGLAVVPWAGAGAGGVIFKGAF